jgi:predicted CoA-binding protein
MNHDRYDDDYIRDILNSVRNVAIVGASPAEHRPSHFVVKYLAERGYNVFPINPGHGGRDIAGIPTFARLADLPERLDMVDVFRSPEYVPDLLDQVLALPHRPKVFWMQLGVRHDASAARAEASGMQVVMNRCPKIEYGRLSREINWAGVNTRTLTSRRAKRLPGGVQRLALGSKSK